MPSSTIRDLGVYIDLVLSMKSQVGLQQCSQLRSIRRQVPTAVFQSLVVALVLSRLDYSNSVLAGLAYVSTSHSVFTLQSAQNAAARLIFKIRRYDHITDALISLH